MTFAVIWGAEDQLTTGSTGTVWAYTDRMNHTAQSQTKEVLNGTGVVKYRKNWGCKARVDGTFVIVDAANALVVRAALVADTAIKVTDATWGDLLVYLDSDSREKIAGESGPGACRVHITGWSYPVLGEGATGVQGAGWGS